MAVTNAAGSLKADVPVGTSAYIYSTLSHNPPPPFQPFTHHDAFFFSRRRRRPHRAPALDRVPPAPRPTRPTDGGAVRPALGRVRARAAAGGVPRGACAGLAARRVGGGHVCVGERADVRDARRGGVFGQRGR